MWKIIVGALALMGVAESISTERLNIVPGLCIESVPSSSCPTRKQVYGVCCEKNGQILEFDNFCLACSAVLIL